jgi:uncharacterized membrane protein YccC
VTREAANGGWRRRVAAATDGFLTPGPRMVDELECVASVLLAIVFGHLIGAKNISWAAFCGYMVMRGSLSESVVRGGLRMIGTLIGALLAVLATPLIWTSPAATAACLALVGGVTLYASLIGKRSYAWLFVGLTFVIVLLDKVQHPQLVVEDFASTRIRENVAGTIACVLVSLVSAFTLRRRWPGSSMPAPAPFGWYPDAARHAVQGAVALAMLPFLGAAWPLPAMSQAAVSIVVLMLIPVSSIGRSALIPVSRRIALRIAGCMSGAAIAAAILFMAHWSSDAAAPVLIVGTMLGVGVGRHIENSQHAIAYAGMQFILAILVTLVPDSYAHAEIAPAISRLSGILVGIGLLVPVLVGWHLIAPSAKPGSL